MTVAGYQATAQAAVQYLAENGDASESDSDHDELEPYNDDWEWIFETSRPPTPSNNAASSSKKRKATEAFSSNLSSSPKIIGAQKEGFSVFIGDAVVLKAERNEQWVALVYDFVEDEVEGAKEARFMWFATPTMIRNKAKRRNDAYSNEIYLTSDFDDNPLNTVIAKANVCSPQVLRAKYPTGKIPRRQEDEVKTFVCRRGCNTRTATFTEEFTWENVFGGAADLEPLKDRVETETKATRKKKPEQTYTGIKKGLDDFVVEDDDFAPRTPSKRKKLEQRGTPRSGQKQGKSPGGLTTPTHKRIIVKKPLEFTPLGTRVLSPSHVTSSPFQVARSHLHVSSVPSALPCREEEFSQVYSYLESAITAGTGSCIYISGTPGTGKTATVREVVAQLNASVQAEELDDFIFVEINGMKVTDPHQSYSLLWEALMGERLSPSVALNLLEREFSSPSPRRVPCVVLMDELDQLVTKNQSVMYNFFNWPNMRHSRLIVLAVANTMDLPERTLSNKISSRLGLTRITFPGYSHEQLMKIIQSRLEGVPGDIVDPDAVQFASRKVAQVSGDARRALDICRRAVEIAEVEASAESPDPDTPSKKRPKSSGPTKADGKQLGRVTIATVQQAIREATTTPLQQYLRCLPLASKVFLAAIMARLRRTGIRECLLGDVVEEAQRLGTMTQLLPIHDFLLCGNNAYKFDQAISKAKSSKNKPPRILAMGAAAMDLVEGGVVMVESRKGERTAKVRLSIAEDEVKLALKDDIEVQGLGFS